MNIVYWSTMHGQACTANMLASALYTSISLNKKTLVTQSHYNLNNLEVPLIGRIEEKEFFKDIGLDALLRCIKSQDITEEIMDSCSVSVIKNQLDILIGTKQSSRDIFEADTSKLMEKIVNMCSCYYEIVFIDTNSGMGGVSMNLLENADVIVVNLKQNEEMLTQYFDKYEKWIMERVEKGRNKQEGKVFYLFGGYDGASKYNLHNLRRRYKRLKNNNSGIVPYNTQFNDSISDGSLVRYFMQNIGQDEADSEAGFFYQISSMVHKIMKLSEIKT